MKTNPSDIKNLPVIMIVDDRRSLLGFLIKSHSNGNYNHICKIHKPGLIASQDVVGFRERSVEEYMRPHYFLKFWRYKNVTEEQRKKWLSLIQADLDAPWVRRRYDILGIIGQFLHIRWLQNPHTKYCSERVASQLREIFNMYIPPQPTPSDLNKIFKENDNMEVVGYWFYD